MSPLDARMTVLIEEIRRDWSAVRDQLARARGANAATSVESAAYVALALDHAYQAFETMLVRVERAHGLPERAGATWHASLLADASMALPKLRPAVFPRESLREWEALLRFRHFLRHAYGVELEPVRLAENVERLARAFAASDTTVQALLDAMSASEG